MLNREFEKGARTRVAALWREPRRYSHVLGGTGYSLPDMGDLVWHSVGDEILDNWVVGPRKHGCDQTMNIEPGVNSTGNVVVLGSGSRVDGKCILWGCDNTVIFGGNNPQHVRANIYVGGAQTLTFIGGKTTCNGASVFVHGNRTSVLIGEDCMFSHGIVIRTSDDHAIFDLETGAHLNAIQNILIEPHVWLCPEVHVLKGVRIGVGAIVAERSLVTSDVGRCVLTGGVPTRVLREKVSWDRPVIPREGMHIEVTNLIRALS